MPYRSIWCCWFWHFIFTLLRQLWTVVWLNLTWEAGRDIQQATKSALYIYINIYLCVCVCAPLVTSSALLQCSKANRQRGSNTKASLFANTRVFGLGPRPCASSLERIRPRMRIRVLILVTHLVEVSLRILVGQVSLRTVSDCFELWPLRLKQSQDIEKNPCPAWHNANCCNCLSRRRRALGVERVSRSVHSN